MRVVALRISGTRIKRQFWSSSMQFLFTLTSIFSLILISPVLPSVDVAVVVIMRPILMLLSSPSRWLTAAIIPISCIEAWPLSQSSERQVLTLDVCANQKAVPDANCWALANIPDYLNHPTTGWTHTTPTCQDSTRCCVPSDDSWSTCYLRLALPAAGQDCTTLNDHPCTAQADLDPNLDPSILAQVIRP